MKSSVFRLDVKKQTLKEALARSICHVKAILKDFAKFTGKHLPATSNNTSLQLNFAECRFFL